MEIKDGQVYALNSLITDLMPRDDREMKLYIISELLDKEVDTTKNLNREDWVKIRNEAYPDWVDGDWEPCEEFEEKVRELSQEYLEEVVGYQKLV